MASDKNLIYFDFNYKSLYKTCDPRDVVVFDPRAIT